MTLNKLSISSTTFFLNPEFQEYENQIHSLVSLFNVSDPESKRYVEQMIENKEFELQRKLKSHFVLIDSKDFAEWRMGLE